MHQDNSHGAVDTADHRDGLDANLDPCDQSEMEPFAIVGMSLRFPGEATSAESFWNLLVEKRSTATEFPGSRFNVNSFYNPDPNDNYHSVNCLLWRFVSKSVKLRDADN
jgi:hypothetical protein